MYTFPSKFTIDPTMNIYYKYLDYSSTTFNIVYREP